MNKFISQILDDIFADFVQTADADGCLCDCKNLTFEANNIPDYEKPLIQQLYLLRYLPAYFYEYYKMYECLIKREFIANKFKVLSIGCGCGIDLWGLYFALKDLKQEPEKRLEYVGIDKIIWDYREEIEIDKVFFITKDVATLNKFQGENINIITFPKSIGEFTDDEIRSIHSTIRNTKFNSNRFALLGSFIEWRKDVDEIRLRSISQLLCQQNRYECIGELDHSQLQLKKGTKIHTLCPACKYSQEILSRLIELNKECPTYRSNGECTCRRDCESLNKYPILSVDYINFKIVLFERRNR